MKLPDLQDYLKQTGRYAGKIDGLAGRLTDAGIMLAMTDGPDTRLTEQDFIDSAKHLGVQTAAIKTFWKLESNGVPFVDGRAPILPERHRFSKNTGRKFDARYPDLSAPKWDKTWYPKTQDGRWDIILQWYRLLAREKMDIDAAFASVSYGGPQIMGENFFACGFRNPWNMAVAMARDERTQLEAFEKFITNTGTILRDLRNVSRDIRTVVPVVRAYNGTAFAENKYDTRFLSSFIAFGGK